MFSPGSGVTEIGFSTTGKESKPSPMKKVQFSSLLCSDDSQIVSLVVDRLVEINALRPIRSRISSNSSSSDRAEGVAMWEDEVE